jgi:tetratricopeptide (TPR) repeat protein
MAKTPAKDPDEIHTSDLLEGGDGDSGYGPPEGFEGAAPSRSHASADDLAEAGAGRGSPPGGGSRLKVLIGVAVVLVLAGALLGYRAYHRAKVVAEGMALAEPALRLDTAAGYRKAADVLVPAAKFDPLEAGSMRAFALAMLFLDYRDAEAGKEAEQLIAVPARAATVPPLADLASAALFLARGSVGDAATYAGRAGSHPRAGALMARLAFSAGNAEAGVEPVARAAAADPKMAATLAMQGELARRVRKDVLAARAAYAAALAQSPTHPRAAYGLAKLALASQIPMADALPPLQALLRDTQATPRNERARAGLHLAALQLRAGDRAAAAAALDAVGGLERQERSWAELAVLIGAAERKAYRAVQGPPPIFQSASDDDPLEAPAVDPTPPPPPPPKVAPKPVKKAPPPKKAVAPAKKGAPAPAKPAAKKPPAPKP